MTNGEAMSATLGGLGNEERLIVLGAAQSLEVSPLLLLMGRRSVAGWYSGTTMDSQDTLSFSVLSGMRPMIASSQDEEGYRRAVCCSA